MATFAMDNMARNESSPSKGSARLIFFVPDLLSESSREVLKNITVRTSRGKVWADLDAKWTRTEATGSLNTIVEDDVALVLEPLSQASSLELIVPQQTGEPKTYEISLAGSTEALEELNDCLATVR